MNYGNIEKLIEYGTSYRRQELADLLEYTPAWDLADDICAVMLTVRATMPGWIWEKMLDNLLQYQTNVQISLIEEAEDEE